MREIVVERVLRPSVKDIVVDLEHLGGRAYPKSDVHDPNLELVLHMDYLRSRVHVHGEHHSFFHGFVPNVKLSMFETKIGGIYFSENILASITHKYWQEYQKAKLLNLDDTACTNVEREQNLPTSINHFCRNNPFVLF